MKDFIEYLFQQITTNPDKVHIEEVETPESLSYSVTLSLEDIPFVIGKMGRNIKSIRNLARARSMKFGTNKQIYIDIKDQTEPNIEA